MRYLLKRGTKQEFENYKGKMRVGECCALTDAHTIVFKFGENDIKELKFDETVTEEKADILIKAIEKYFGNNFRNIMT